jgi:hypothetical protein
MIGGSDLSRRALVGAGALAALGAAGCGDRTPARPAGGDAAVLGTLLAVERELGGAWSAAARFAPAHGVGARSRAHLQALTRAGAAPGRAVPDTVAAAAARVRAARTRAAALDALLATERGAAGAYLDSLPGLGGGEARALAAGLYADSAQRASLLLAALGRDPLPDAFAGTLT